MSIEIRNFKQEDMQLLKVFYQSVTNDRKVLFWWVGPEENWDNVFCAFESGKMVAKGQVEIINSIPEGHPKDSRHSIYLNLKTLPERELDSDLMNRLFESLYDRALEMKQYLSTDYKTNLCVGNYGEEVNNNQFFIEEKGFTPLETLFSMERDLQHPIDPAALLHPDLSSTFWKMDSEAEEKQYLEAEFEIWPDSALGLNRLREYKSNPFWTVIPVWENNNIVACAMAWQEDKMGVIEDVFVKEAWRKQGIARFLLTTALTYLKDVGLEKAKLMVDTDNDNALSLYRSVGFEVVEDERRYYMELV